MQLRIEAWDLPGRGCGPGDNFPGYRNVHVGVQRRDRRNELLELHPGDAPSAVWTLECSAVSTPTGVDLKGPYIQGRPGGRFIYLSWGSVDASGAFTLFRRAKLMLDAIGPDVLDAAVRPDAWWHGWGSPIPRATRCAPTCGHRSSTGPLPPPMDLAAHLVAASALGSRRWTCPRVNGG
jgi:hypothetical protein